MNIFLYDIHYKLNIEKRFDEMFSALARNGPNSHPRWGDSDSDDEPSVATKVHVTEVSANQATSGQGLNTQICWYFLNRKCKFGNKCKFAHAGVVKQPANVETNAKTSQLW